MKQKLLSIVIASSLLFSQLINFAQAPVMGTTAEFVLFTITGAVGNTGISQLTGNVGTNTGAITAFGNVNGVMHNSDGATSAAANDLRKLYTQLYTITATLNHAPLLGRDTLIAGIYAIAGNSTLNDTITLDAKGDSTAVFIFQIGGTFATGDSAVVVLLNGAQACNVFWKVEGKVSLGTATVMKGTIVANNAAIDIASGVILEGRVLSTAGAITINNTTASMPVGCGSPLLTGPIAPVFVASSCYVIFSGNGAVANAGITTAVGDIGTNVTSTTGFDPLMVTGTIHTKPDVSTAAAATDLLLVYDYLNALVPDIELLFPAQFGNDLVLTPHTYLLDAATSLTDTLYLNAQGNTDAVFVMLINGALSTSTHSNIVLMNGAKAGNVFWKVEGAVSINDSSVFNGTIIANNAAVSLTTGTALTGRAFTTNGALSTAAINAALPPNSCNELVPLNWVYFRGKAFQNNVLLEWGTANEINNSFFTIQKSSDGQKFELLTTVNAAAGNMEHHYTFTDNQPYNFGYYIISQTDKVGRISFYKTIQVKNVINTGFKVTHYVQGNNIHVQISGTTPEVGMLELYSMEGKKIFSQKIVLKKELNTYQIVKPTQKGIYMIRVSSVGEKMYSDKIVL